MHPLRPLLLALVAFVVSLGAPAAAQAQPQDLILGTEGALPPAPSDYVTETHGAVTWDFPRQARDEVAELMGDYQEAWTRISNELGGPVDATLTVRVGRNPEEMQALAPLGLPPPTYAVGVAYPGRGVVLLTLTAPGTWQRPPLSSVFTHELSHIALHRAVGGNPVPRWFTEGLAIHQAREASFERARVLVAARYENQRIPLRQLSGRFPDRPFQVDLAYAQSADVVRYLLSTNNGPRKLRALIARVRDGVAFEEALVDAYYTSLRTLEREWVQDLESRQTAFPILVGGGVVWVLAAILLPIAWRRRRREYKEKLAEMAAREEEEAEAMAALQARVEELLESARAADEAPEGVAIRPPDGVLPTVTVDGEVHTLH